MAEKMTIVVFSGQMDRALAAFNIATTAASMGMEDEKADARVAHAPA